jgi:hypothetical protein
VLPVDSETEFAVIRYDGDPDVFTALAWAHCITEDIAWSVQPPEPRLYRCNPDYTREYGWLLGLAERRGPGVWMGATVRHGTYFEPEWSRALTAKEGKGDRG